MKREGGPGAGGGERRPHLDLLEGHLEAEGLVVVRVQGVLLDRGLLLLQPLAVLHQVDLHVRVCGIETETRRRAFSTNRKTAFS